MKFLSRNLMLAGHDYLVEHHGGLAGVRDEGLFASALYRPVQKNDYGETNVFVLAAAYAYGIVKNHPFLDGNKRSGWLAAATFLKLNGIDLKGFAPVNIGNAMVFLASSEMSEEDFSEWLRCLAV